VAHPLGEFVSHSLLVLASLLDSHLIMWDYPVSDLDPTAVVGREAAKLIKWVLTRVLIYAFTANCVAQTDT